MKTLLVLFLSAALAAGGFVYYRGYAAGGESVSFRTAQVTRGELLETITATGTVVAEEFVDIGAQVVGRIKTLGDDPGKPGKTIDYCSEVEQGTVLAEIDDSVYKAQVAQAEASLARGEADLLQAQARRDQTEQDWKRAQTLLPSNAIAQSDYDLAQSEYKGAVAAVAVAAATIKQNEAALSLARTNLGYTIIRSPIDGTIVDRRVNIGQTVVASFNAPSLFLIAKDLRRMQVWASVNEADIGRIHQGMPVRFSVDAFPGDAFHGTVEQIRLNAKMTQNVVLYTVVVATDNSDLKLLPYLTANLQFVLDERKDVLRVPNVALRWEPQPAQVAPDARASLADEPSSEDEGRADKKADAPTENNAPRRGRLWVEDGKFVRPIEVELGPSDGLNTEVRGPDLRDDMEVVVGEIRREESRGSARSPFSPPQFPRSRSGNRQQSS